MHAASNEGENCNLRQRAELLAKAAGGRHEPLSLAEAQKLLHELEVHQIELELQNEELRRSQLELERSKARYFEFYDLAPMGFFIVSEKGLLLEANLTAASWLGVDRRTLVGQPMATYIFPDDKHHFYRHHQQLFQTRSPLACELRMVRKDGTIFWGHLACNVFQHSDGALACRAVVTDITDRKNVEAELRESEQCFANAFEFAPIGKALVAPNGTWLKVNLALCRMLGYSENEMLSTSFQMLTHPDDLDGDLAYVQQMLHGEISTYQMQKRYFHKSGAIVWALLSVSQVKDEHDRPQYFISQIIDITEHKQAEAALRASEEEFRSLAEAMPQIVWITRADGWNIYFNQQWVEYTGLTMEESYGHGWNIPFHPDDRQRAWEAWQNATQNGATYSLECRLRRADGAYRWWLVRGVPLRDGEGKILKWFGTCTDIEDIKQAQESLQESQSKLQAALSSMTDAVFISDTEGRFIEFNEAFATFHRFRNKEECAKTLAEYPMFLDVFLPNGDLATLEQWAVPRALRGETVTSAEYILLRKDTGETWVGSYSFAPIRDQDGTIVGSVVTGRDITERKQAEKALRESEERYRTLFNSMMEGFCLFEVLFDEQDHPNDLLFLDINPAFEMQSGLRNARGKRTRELVPQLEGDWYEFYGKVAVTGEPAQYENEAKELRRWFTVSAYRIGGPESRKVGVLFHDITERKRTEDQIRQLSRAVEQSPSSIVITDTKGAIEYVNPKFTQVTGYTLEEVRGQNPRLLKGDKTTPKVYHRLWQTITQGREWRGEFHNRKKNGKLYWELASISPILDEVGRITHFLAVKEDITERKLLEEQLRQAQKLESIGQLAGGVAHDYNNVLAATMMHLNFLQLNTSFDTETQETLKALVADARRSANLTRQLLMFSRRSVLEVKRVDLNELVTTLLKMLNRLIEAHIAVKFDRCERLPAVEADAGMIEQVVMNLVINARDAMPKGGKITIRTEPIQVEEERISGNRTMLPGPFVCLSVTDNGCGMDEATQKRIFEPFFTTKEPGKGTGLGLATVYGIITQHKGWVELESELGKGTTFKVFLPATTQGIMEPTQSGKMAFGRGHEMILLVEDEASLRGAMAIGLRRLGYQLLEAGNGQEAMKIWQQQGPQIDLLFSDMVMPEGMTGLELAEKLKQEKPNLKVLLSSGYNVEMVGQGMPTAGGIRYLQKPYDLQVLAKVIRECLER